MPPNDFRILISPLDWGLGHSTRCIAIIRQLLEAGYKITIAGSGRSLLLLQKEFPLIESIEIQSFSPSYPPSGKMLLHLLLLLPKFISSIFNEHQQLKKILLTNRFDVVISDNRYGFWNPDVKSILITHQIMIKAPAWLRFAEFLFYILSRLMISRFDECWIPDNETKPGLSGDLSHKYTLPGNTRFIGPLTRFTGKIKYLGNVSGKPKITVIISGPEPQRSIFEDLIINQLIKLNITATIVSGKPDFEKPAFINNGLTIIPHLETSALESVIASSDLIICRSGYSSIMDLSVFGSKVLFVPTPGQTEQLYLAKLHQNSGTALWRPQDKLNLETDIQEALKYKGFKMDTAISPFDASILYPLKSKS
ncbi:MAG: glycosyltransferase [Bacteroidales bacterium]